MFDSRGALRELSAERSLRKKNTRRLLSALQSCPNVATATQIFTFCPGLLTLERSGAQHACVSARACVRRVCDLRPPESFWGRHYSRRGELRRGGDHSLWASSVFTEYSSKHSADYGCPPLQLFIWYKLKKKKKKRWVDHEGHARP